MHRSFHRLASITAQVKPLHTASSQDLATSFQLQNTWRPSNLAPKEAVSFPGRRLVVPDGKRVAVWDADGNLSFMNGPSSRWLLGRGWVTQEMERVVASQGQFLVVERTTGESDIRVGPSVEWTHPQDIVQILTFNAMEVGTNEAIVIYSTGWSQDGGTGVERRVVTGPVHVTPKTSTDWVHEFVWHGTDEVARRKGVNRKLPGALKFKTLRLVPDQLYFDVEKVRTRDDALLNVKIMLFFELFDIEQMIDSTHDPISDLINTLTADVIEMTSSLGFEEFRAQTDRLNSLETYPTLTAASQKVGFRITKVVFRGYEASDTLQAMHDAAIEERTRMRLTQESEEQEQTLMDFRQEKQEKRSAKDRYEAERTKQHDLSMAEMQQDAALRADQKKAEQHEAMLTLSRKSTLVDEENKMRAMEKHYEKLRDLGVDLTRHLGPRADKIIQLDQTPGGTPPQLHIGDTTA